MEIYPIPGFEEPFSSFSHLLAAPLFLVWGGWLVVLNRRSKNRVISLSVLTICTVFLLSMSGVYHLLGQGIGRAVLKQLDIAGVFALIAGTATPIHAVLFRGLMRWFPVLLVWSVAATGITLRTIFSDSLPLAAGTGIFLTMGWGGVVTCGLLWKQHGFHYVRYLLYGGIAYSVGAVAIIIHYPTLVPGVIGPHELWHVAVLGGLSLHWLFIAESLKQQPYSDVDSRQVTEAVEADSALQES